MNRDDVIRMVREVGFKPEFFSPEGIDKWEHFAQLVAAAEREKVAQMFDGAVWSYDYREIAAAIRARGIKNEN
jgi:hypothetical protein